MTVGELGERMAWREFKQWVRFSSEEPFLGERIELSGAVVAATLANINRGKGKAAYRFEDFMPIDAARRSREAGGVDEETLATANMSSFFAFMGRPMEDGKVVN